MCACSVCSVARTFARVLDATHTDLEPLLHPGPFRFVLTCDSDVCGSASIAHHVRRVMEMLSQRKIGHALYAVIVLLPCAQASLSQMVAKLAQMCVLLKACLGVCACVRACTLYACFSRRVQHLRVRSVLVRERTRAAIGSVCSSAYAHSVRVAPTVVQS